MNAHYRFLPVTGSSLDAVAAIHGFADELVSHGSITRVIFEAIAADPECALAQAYAAALFLTQMTREGYAQAAPRIVAAERHAAVASERERMSIAAIAAWGRGETPTAVRIFRSIVESWPHDLVAAKFCQILELQIGDFAGMVRTSAMAAAVEERAGYALGLHAFALEQVGQAALALRYARRADDLSPDRDPWAQHAIAHALVAMDQPIEARAFLHAAAPGWDRCSSFMLTHNWWHVALLDLHLRHPAGALALYDERVWGVRKGHVQDQINAISLLARLEMRGVASGWRWDDIANHVEARIDDRICDFVDLHLVYALARAERGTAATRLAHALEAQPVAGAVARAMIAHACGSYRKVVAELGPVRGSFGTLGGSNIQRELFEAIFTDSVARMYDEPRVVMDEFRVAA